MTERERLGLLRGVAELAGASDASLRSLVSYFDEVSVPPGLVLAREGRLGHEFFVVAEGEVEVCRDDHASRLRPGDSFGWEAMHERGRHDATVVTTSLTRLLVMSHAQFRAAEALVGSSVQPVASSVAQTRNTAHTRQREPA